MTTLALQDLELSPAIAIGKDEHRQLTELAHAGMERSPEVADGLLSELDRAAVVPDEAVPADVVRMGSTVRYRSGEDEREVTLVYPAKADIAAGRISVLTPVGAALIGLQAGQSIASTTRDGRPQVLTVLSVTPPAGDDPGPRAA